ncbi:MAG: hypothetical protein IJT44_05305 [Clostridia bacterium]|nr:hypothetical protein [Clostridia bacterium]
MTTIRRRTALVLCVCMLCSALHIHGFAAGTAYGPYEYDEYVRPEDGTQEINDSYTFGRLKKAPLNLINGTVNALLCGLSLGYPSPREWKNVRDFDGEGFLPGRKTYAKKAGKNNVWRVGYGSRSIIPDDFEPGKYYLARDVEQIMAIGVQDDNRVRAAAFDDGSGEGAVIFAVADALGVTRADTLTVRKRVLEWAKKKNIPISSINLSATHSHSAIDTQGITTELGHKLVANYWRNMLNVRSADKKLKNADAFKAYYLNAVTEAIREALLDMRPGKLSYARVDTSKYAHDKRGLIAAEDLPDAAVFRFDPADGSAGVYFADVACHPTSFDARHKLLSADYIYSMEQRVAEKTGYRFLFAQGPSGMISRRNVSVDESRLPESERLGAETRYMGKVFADTILRAKLQKLSPVLNVRHRQFLHSPDNKALVLAAEARLVNDAAYTDRMRTKLSVVVEEGYVEFGGRVGLCLFPVELYPETFYGTQILNGGDYKSIAWDGKEWDSPVPADLAPRKGIELFAMHLTNDSLGYCVPDTDYAFVARILADGDWDEALSLGKHTASALVGEFQKLMESLG